MSDQWVAAIQRLEQHGLTGAADVLRAHRPATAADMAGVVVESADDGFESGVVLERDFVGFLCMKWLQARTGDMSWSRAIVSAPVAIMRKDSEVSHG